MDKATDAAGERKRKKCVFTYPEDTIEKRACKEKKKLNKYNQKSRQREEGIGARRSTAYRERK
jgi:hypothetical protein